MTDWGVHLIDYALFGMKASTPKSVMAMGGKFAYPNDAAETPDTLQTIYDFGDFSLLWEHATGIDGGNYGRNHGIAFIGNNGTLVLDRGGWEVIPEHDRPHWSQDLGPKIEAVPLQQGVGQGLGLHTQNFLEAVKSRDKSILKAPIKIGYDAAVVSHMGNIAYKTGERLFWDAENNKFNHSEADALISKQYHNGWKFPKMG